ncbi:hypothetical protein PVAG01_05049 [Phlyctema vagabunda]|uniref:Heterokaryon incompatibility domain-containing protein n=1 Tax=Phlyctema vagabunda TaxID=108571 RepID=A0ABR4PIZ2_9HELO
MDNHLQNMLSVRDPLEGLQKFEYSALAHHRIIRLLYIYPTKATSLPIRCRVQETNIDECSMYPKYKALSYVWGASGITSTIYINEKRFEVTANCFAALRRLREIKTTYVWIDAICINQNDKDEKKTQIPLMRDIYYFADEVICWLGYSESDLERDRDQKVIEDRAFGLMHTLDRMPGGYLKYSLQSIERLHGDEPGWRALAKILNHKWFTRIWVYQEVIVAARVKVLFQYYCETYETFIGRAVSLWDRVLEVQTRTRIHDPIENMRQGLFCVSRQFQARRCYDRDKRQLQCVTLQDVLIETQNLDCTCPKDRVFALLGVLKDNPERIKLDYGHSVAKIYTYCTLNAIQESRSLELLSLAGSSHRIKKNSLALPSWVPDWRIKVWERTIPLQHSLYTAASGFGLQKSYQHESSVLEVHGIQVDTIIAGSFNLDSRPYSYGLADWESQHKAYPNGDPGYHAWVRTITADRYDKDIRGFSRPSTEIFQQYLRLSQLPRRRDEDGMIHLFNQTIASTIKSRAFFITRSGYMGLGPLGIDTGDMVCILRGCNVPFLIRNENNHYVLVGECFVWGLMDGEAVKKVVDSDFSTYGLI